MFNIKIIAINRAATTAYPSNAAHFLFVPARRKYGLFLRRKSKIEKNFRGGSKFN
jgi:hypothetical protein